ncbi:MAG: O-antigen ligase family protein, partial [bacterium]|nr:O-antigen ligase family protein [bacterium]
MRKIFNWIDNNILLVLAGFLMVFIPLYPKWPLFDVLPGYNVRVRVEDFFVLFVLLVALVQFVRRKMQFSLNPVTIGLIGYLAIGLISTLVAIFVTGSVPMQTEFVGKTFLHWLRRIEYFSLFFIVFGSIKSIKSIKILTIVIFLTLILVTLYGYGQKYLYWPAFSTMNREYAKGWWLYLTEHARVLSTFGGHYDLAGYLVITLSLCWSFYFGAKRWWTKALVGIILAGGFWLLILTASRISFAAYMVGLSVVVLVWAFRKGFYWGVSRWFMAVFLSMLIMLSFGDLSDRFLRLVRLDQRIGNLKQIVLKPIGNMPQNKAVFLENNIAAVTSKTDMPPLPRDVINNQPLMIEMKTASGASYFIERPREYSKNATLYDLSTAIRLDATWPRAIAGFKSNILTGQGYATLTQESKYEFTQGESTDSDFLRALGETGLLGFLAFFGTLVIMGITGFKALGGVKDSFVFSLVAGFLGALVGLLGNAAYIDIFEASKVAYIFWGVAGLTMGSLYFLRDKIKENYEPLKLEIPIKTIFTKLINFAKSDKFWVTVIVIAALALRFYKLDAPVADWHSWRQADTSAVTRNFIKNDKIDFMYPTFDDLSSVASGLPNLKGLRMVEFPIYNIITVFVRIVMPEFSVESAGRATSAGMSIFSLVFLFLIIRKLVSRRAAYLVALTFAFIPYNIFYSRTILPEPTMVAFSLGAVWFAMQNRFVLFAILAAFALLAKPYAIFLIAPVIFLNRKLIIFCLFSLIPVVLWRLWIQQFPEAIPASDWLF